MSFIPDVPTTEDALAVALSSSPPPLPPQEQRLGATTVSWWETDPGEVYVHAEGGTMDDRHYASTLVSLQLEPHGYRRAQFDMDVALAEIVDNLKTTAMVKEADWPTVMAKAKRLIQSGQVRLLRNGFNNIMAHVTGDHGEYDTEISRDDPSSRAITGWQCGCVWDQYAFQRTRKFKKFEGRPCLVGNTMVSLANGSFKRIDEIVVGDEVLTHDGVGTVSQTMNSTYSGNLAVIHTYGYDEPLRITSQHRVYAYGTPQRFRKPWQGENDQGFKLWDEDFLFTEDPEWIEPRDLRAHDWLTGRVRLDTFGGSFDLGALIPEGWLYREQNGFIQRFQMRRNGKVDHLVAYKLRGFLPRLVEPSHDLMIIMGLYAAEGNLSHDIDGHCGEIQWSFNINEEDTLAHQLRESIGALDLGDPHTHMHPIANKMTVRLTNHPLALFLAKACGRFSAEKRLHPWLVHLSPDYQETFITWLWAGDGHRSPGDTRKHLSTASDQMAWQVHDMLARCGYLPSWNRVSQNGGPANRQDKYTINRVSWVEDRRDRRKAVGRRHVSDDLYAVKIREIGIEPFDDSVYNLTVLPQHSYVANGKVVANCSHVLATYWSSLATPLDEDLTPGQAEALGTGQKLPAPAVPEHPPEIEDRIQKGEKPPEEHEGLPRSFGPEGDIIQGDQQKFGPEPPDAIGHPPGPAQAPLAPPPGGMGPTPPGVIPPFPGEQMAMPWGGPGTTPGGGVSPPGAYSVPGAKPPNQPNNPIQNPQTFSKVADFNAPEVVRLKNDILGVAEGPVKGQYGDGEYREVPAGAKGEVLSQDPTTGWVEVLVPLDDSGPNEPFHVKCFTEASDLEPTGQSNAFIRRH